MSPKHLERICWWSHQFGSGKNLTGTSQTLSPVSQRHLENQVSFHFYSLNAIIIKALETSYINQFVAITDYPEFCKGISHLYSLHSLPFESILYHLGKLVRSNFT